MKRWLAIAFLIGSTPVDSAAAAAWSDEVPPTGRVTALRLEPTSGNASLTIEVDGPVRISDFKLDGPPRVVVDIEGAQQSLPTREYAGIDRGGIVSIRAAQNRPNVVRVVVQLAQIAPYQVTRVKGGIRIELRTDAAPFEPWGVGTPASGGQAEMEAEEAEAEVEEAPQPRRAQRPSQQRPTQQGPTQRQFGRGSSNQPRITVTFEEADIRDVLATFAEFGGRTILPGTGVTGNVSGTIVNQPWDIALASLLQANGLAAEEQASGIILVLQASQIVQRQTQDPLVTQTFRVNYVPAAELVATLTPLRTERGQVVANQTTNSIVVTDVEGAVNNILALAQQLDIPTPQVTIESKIVFVNRTNLEDLGFTYDLRDPEGSQFGRVVQTNARDPVTGELTGEQSNRDIFLVGGSSLAAIGNAASRVSGAALEVAISLVLGRFSLVTFVGALQGAELADVQAEPVITTLDNQEAEILVGERTPIRVVDVGAQGGGAVAPTATAQLQETGIRLRVVPHITADRRVLMQLEAERSQVQPGIGDAGITFATQEAATRVLVNDGETTVIAGLTVSEVLRTQTGIPLLQDLPLIGALFRTTRDREQKRDLLILVTPHIVDEQR